MIGSAARSDAAAEMSVGMQRLRDDADAIRTGATDKGYDAAIVDAALGAR